MTEQDRVEFDLYLKAMTNKQVLGVYQKERDADRKDYAELAYLELCKRGMA